MRKREVMFLCLSLVVLLSLSVVSADKITGVTATASKNCTSTAYLGGTPFHALDGDTGTMWRTCTGPTQWIELDLGAEYDVSKIVFNNAMPALMTHSIYMGASANPSTLVESFSINEAVGGIIERTYSQSGVRYIQIKTTAGASWLGWFEIDVYGTPTPTSTSFITVISPNGGESFAGGSTKTITWTSSNVETVEIRLMDYLTGVEYRFAEYGLSSNVAASYGGYSWTIPTTIPVGSNYRIAIANPINTIIADTSDVSFSIVAPSIAICSDTDGGVFYDVNGIVSSGDIVKQDYCIVNTNSLVEYSCASNGKSINSAPHNCSTEGKVCVNGACVTPTINVTCEDSDGGKVYGVKGTTTKEGFGSTTDFCVDSIKLNEALCNNDGNPANAQYDCSKEGKVCKDGACVEPTINYINGCSYLSDEVFNKIAELQGDEDDDVILREGDKINYRDYVVIPGDVGGEVSTIVRLTSVKNQSSGYYSDSCRFTDVFSGGTYESVFSSEGVGTLLINGRVYTVTMSGAHISASEDYIVTLDYPQTTGSDKLSFESCSVDGEELRKSCIVAKEFIKNPKNVKMNNREWILNWNDSWGYDQEKNYYASFSQSSDYGYNYVSLEMTELENTEDVKTRLTWAIEEGICQKEKIYDYDSEYKEDYKVIYLCKNLWEIAYNNQRNLGSDLTSNQITAIWISGNTVFKVYSSNYDYNNCYDYEDCKRLEEERHRQQQERIVSFLEKLVSNEMEYVGGFYLPWETTQFVNLFLTSCGSEIEEEGYVGSWSCKLEPAVCPPHGEQKEVCIRWNENLRKEETREAEISCNPGICSGCYVPKWFGGSGGDNKCIPYGFRFEHEFDSFEEEVYDENYEEISVADFNRDLYEQENLMKAEATAEGKITLFVNREVLADEEIEYSVTISPDTIEGDFDVYYLSSGDKADITIKEFAGAREEKLSISIGDISFNSANPDESIVSLILGYSGTRTRPLIMNAYCDINGRVKEQKVKNYDGSWAKCQNNYECESNLCSSGECIELKNAIQEVGRIKKFFFGILCKIANPISGDEYNTCMFNFLGEELPSGGGSSSSSSSGGGR